MGTQFGMLISYLKEVFPNALYEANVLQIEDLVSFYRKAKKRFDEDIQFQEISREAVVKLQLGNEEYRKAWKLLCEQSRREFQVIYDILQIELTERGESFYNPFLEEIVNDLDKQKILEISDGAKCVFLNCSKV